MWKQMSPLIFSALVWACTVGAALLGMALHARLPDRHLGADARDVVKLVMALVATISALVLSLLISSASSAHDRQVTQLRALSANIILLDRTLDLYGSEAKALRDDLRKVVQQVHDKTWAPDGLRLDDLDSLQTQDSIRNNVERMQRLAPKNDLQRT